VACARLDDSDFKKYGKDAVHEETAVLALGTENPLATPLFARGFKVSREPPSHHPSSSITFVALKLAACSLDAKDLNNTNPKMN
jgi:hypothetical protein